jgi:hypothetical protein
MRMQPSDRLEQLPAPGCFHALQYLQPLVGDPSKTGSIMHSQQMGLGLCTSGLVGSFARGGIGGWRTCGRRDVAYGLGQPGPASSAALRQIATHPGHKSWLVSLSSDRGLRQITLITLTIPQTETS